MFIWGFLGGLVAGLIITTVIYLFIPTAGTLKIDHSNPDKDVYLIEINDLDDLDNKKRITLKMDHNADLSQK